MAEHIPRDRAMTLQITVGRSTRQMVVVKTKAPKSYDQFGTIEVYHEKPDGERFVLIKDEFVASHIMRYGSGTYGAEFLAEDDYHVRGWIEEQLLRRLTHPHPEEE